MHDNQARLQPELNLHTCLRPILVVSEEGAVRTIKTAEELGALLRLQASLLIECRGCLIGEVIWRVPGADGCNWRVSRLEGRGAGTCLLALQTMIVGLREAYNLNPAS